MSPIPDSQNLPCAVWIPFSRWLMKWETVWRTHHPHQGFNLTSSEKVSLERASLNSILNSLIYYFHEAPLTKYHKLGGLNQQKFILSQWRRPEVQNKSVSRDVLPLKALGKNAAFLASVVPGGCWHPWLAAAPPTLPLPPHGLLPCVSGSLSPCKGSSHGIYEPRSSSVASS